MPRANLLHRYAQLAVQLAVPLQLHSRLLIVAPPETYAVVHAVTVAAFRQGAADVQVLYEDSTFDLLRTGSASLERLNAFTPWVAEALTRHAQEGQPILTLHAPNPTFTSQPPADRVAKATAARNSALETYGMLRSRVTFNWSVMAVATRAWAAYLRPELGEEQALEWLWERLGHLMRLDTPDPLELWRAHAQQLMRRCQFLDGLEIAELHLTAAGTDLRLGLPERHRWFGPFVESAQGVTGIPNLPTEEISTLPHRYEAAGEVTVTRPVVVQGQRVENLRLTFREGKVTTFKCTTGEAFFEALLETDEGASRLGEVALVPENSLVAKAEQIFYSTLIDENASCHLALGRAYPVTLQGGSDLSLDDFKAQGGNHSRVHLDFMFGSPQLEVQALRRDGSQVLLMRGGLWVDKEAE